MQVEDAHLPGRNVRPRPLSRALDVAIAASLLILASPLLAAAAAAIKLESRGPAFYRQRRVGKDGRPFELWKLRTMVPGAEAMGAGIYVLEGDPRITRLGRVLRRLSLDELPNLVNVLKGEMAMVGPRPTIQEQVDRYTERQRRRLEVKPGITGWAQVNGRVSLPWPERIELDVWYVEHRSLWLDLKVLALTVKLLVTGRGLYSEDPKQGWDN
jgi:lipopolysaccharide/colanic/teichoic acid biosynthesis glycosyltransferase